MRLNFQNLKLSKGNDMFDLMVEVATHYEKCGDGLSAGIMSSWLSDKKCWYMAVHRFPGKTVASRMIVAKASHADKDACVELLRVNWQSIVAQLALLETAPVKG